MSNKSEDKLEFYLKHKVHLKSRTIDLDDDIDDVSVHAVIRSIHHLISEGAEDITLNINSFGGSVYDGLALYDYLMSIRDHVHISTVAMGKCMSMAPVIYLTGHERYAYPNTTFMFHEASSYAMGPLETMKIEVKETERLSKLMSKLLEQHTTKSASYWTRIKKDKFMTTKEALVIGVVTQLIGETDAI